MQRRKEIAIRPPAHIHEVVERAGRENVFWASARRPGRVPEPGGGTAELHNAVVGSPLAATQSTPSNQPVWQGPYYQLAGDDFVTTSTGLDLSGSYTGWAVLEGVAAGVSNKYVFSYGPLAGADSMLWRIRDADSLRIRAEDDGGNVVATNLTGLSLADDRIVVGAQLDTSGGGTATVRLYAYDSQGLHTTSDSGAFDTTTTTPAGQIFASSGAGAGALSADAYAVGEVRGHITQAEAASALTQSAQHWRIV